MAVVDVHRIVLDVVLVIDVMAPAAAHGSIAQIITPPNQVQQISHPKFQHKNVRETVNVVMRHQHRVRYNVITYAIISLFFFG